MKMDITALKERFMPTKQKQPSNLKLQIQFINFLAYFNAFVSCGHNVYQALKATADCIQGEIKNYLLELVAGVDNDKSIKPFINFAMKFNNETITQIVNMIYQLSLNGLGIEQLEQMLPLMERLKSITINAYIKKEGDDLNIYLATPLLGVTIVSIFFSIGVIATIMVGV